MKKWRVAVITVDCDNLAEQVTAFYETFTEEVPLPTTATWSAPPFTSSVSTSPSMARNSSHAATARMACGTCGFRI